MNELRSLIISMMIAMMVAFLAGIWLGVTVTIIAVSESDVMTVCEKQRFSIIDCKSLNSMEKAK